MVAFSRNRLLVGLAMLAVAWGVALSMPTENPAEGSSTKLQKRSRRSGRKSGKETVSRPANYRSKNFLLHTDLPKKKAEALIETLETMLGQISRYWGRPNKQIIECYVVENIKKWPAGTIHADGVRSILSGAGLTISVTYLESNELLGTKRVLGTKAVVYSVPDRGIPQHEVVHAYCAQTFGTTGPVWYSEGMAEMGQYWDEKDSKVNCHDFIAEYLRESDPKDLIDIVTPYQGVGTWKDYAWRWALCHQLCYNTNYAPRFHALGMGLLSKQRVSFEQVYGSMAKEITFEYLFFLKHLHRGFRVDLCSWNWKAKYRRLRGSKTTRQTIRADRGWQPSRVRVKKGEEYSFSVKGEWKTSKKGELVDADGGDDGTGKLMGIIFDDYKLSEPFELGVYGSFKVPRDGNLLIRCRDQWHEIADNSGKMVIRLKKKGAGTPLPKPKKSVRNKKKSNTLGQDKKKTDSSVKQPKKDETVKLPKKGETAKQPKKGETGLNSEAVIQKHGGRIGRNNAGNVNYVYLAKQKITIPLLVSLKNLTDLEHLDFEKTQLNDEHLVHLKSMTSLKNLNLNDTQVSDDGLKHLQNLSNLLNLHLKGAAVTGTGISHLGKLKKLESLELGRSQATNKGVKSIRSMRSLKYLNLWRTRITNDSLVHLKKLVNLEKLYLSETAVSDAGLKHLRILKKLKILDLKRTKVSKSGVQRLQKALPNCEVLW